MILWSHNDFVWIHCCKQPNYDFCISQGSVPTVSRKAGKTTVIYVNFLRDVAFHKLLKSADVSRRYSKNNTDSFFWDTVYLYITDACD